MFLLCTRLSCTGIILEPVVYVVSGAAVLHVPLGSAVSAGPSDAATDMDAIWVWGVEGECLLSIYVHVRTDSLLYVDVATITITVTITLETKNAIQSNGDGLIIHLL